MHEHQWGPLEHSAISGTTHRKCQVDGCKVINPLDEDDEEEEEKTFHALEYATEKGYCLFVTESGDEFKDYRDSVTIEGLDTYATGTVEAKDEKEAAQKILAGKWEYSQYV